MAAAPAIVVIGAKDVAAQSDGFVLFEAPPADWAASSEQLGVDLPAGGAFARVSWEGHARRGLAALRVAAGKVPGVVCVAATDGRGLEPSGAAGRELIVERVLPALVRHFDSMTLDEHDESPWLLTHVLGALITRKPTTIELDAALAAIEASLGRGDATSTRQNLGAAGNFFHHAKTKDAAAANAVWKTRPLLVASFRLRDARLWPSARLAETLREGFERATPRHARAVLQIATRAVRDHARTPEVLRAILEAAASVAGVDALLARPDPLLEVDLRRAIEDGVAELRHRGRSDSEVAPVIASLRALAPIAPG